MEILVLAKHVQWSREWAKGKQSKGQGRANCKLSLTSLTVSFKVDAYQAHLIRLAHPNKFGKLPLPSPQCAFYLLQILPPHWWRQALNHQSCLYAFFLPECNPDMSWYDICVMFKVYFTKYICTVFTLVQSRSEPLLFSVCAIQRNCTFCTKLINLPEKEEKRQYRRYKMEASKGSCPRSSSVQNQKNNWRPHWI